MSTTFDGIGRDALERIALQAQEQLGVVQARCTELLEENRRLRAGLGLGPVTLPGWVCPACRGFNGEAKGQLAECRACGGARPA